MSRRLTRRSIFKALYSFNIVDFEDIDKIVDESLKEDHIFWIDEEDNDKYLFHTINKRDIEFFVQIVKGTMDNIGEIDKTIEKNLRSWKMERIAKVDLIILRMAIYEILYRDDIPYSVTINEAVELGKIYGTDDSGGFINGVLGRIVKGMDEKGD